ncbi:MAG: cation transporter [Proteobacteria bacterium]|nr:cation transporter [Pseudomonadota bacterium]
MSEKLSDTARVVSKVTWGGVGVNLVLSGIKLVFGFLFNSATLIADGVHSLSDLISDAAPNRISELRCLSKPSRRQDCAI